MRFYRHVLFYLLFLYFGFSLTNDIFLVPKVRTGVQVATPVLNKASNV